VVVAAVTVAIVVYFAGQRPEETPYMECRPGMVSAACVEASKAYEQCGVGSYALTGAGMWNCTRALEVAQWCSDRLHRADAASCRMTGYDYLRCVGADNGALSCYLLETKFISCLQAGASDVAGCKQQRAEAMDCLPLEGMSKPRSCQEVFDDLSRSSQPSSWPGPTSTG
jgi:hypothetical protein